MKTLKNTQMRFLQLIIVFTMISGTAMAQTKTSFAGTWGMDVQNSKTPAKDLMRAMMVDQQEGFIAMSASVVDADHHVKGIQDTAYMDGVAHAAKESKADDFKLPDGKISAFTRTGTAKWSDDNSSLTITTNYSLSINGKPDTFKTIEVWTLDDTGKKLTINYTVNYIDGSENFTYIYTHK